MNLIDEIKENLKPDQVAGFETKSAAIILKIKKALAKAGDPAEVNELKFVSIRNYELLGNNIYDIIINSKVARYELRAELCQKPKKPGFYLRHKVYIF